MVRRGRKITNAFGDSSCQHLICHSSHVGGVNRKITVQDGPRQKHDTLLEEELNQKGLRVGSGGEELVDVDHAQWASLLHRNTHSRCSYFQGPSRAFTQLFYYICHCRWWKNYSTTGYISAVWWVLDKYVLVKYWKLSIKTNKSIKQAVLTFVC
jgi:hypothetical protein